MPVFLQPEALSASTQPAFTVNTEYHYNYVYTWSRESCSHSITHPHQRAMSCDHVMHVTTERSLALGTDPKANSHTRLAVSEVAQLQELKKKKRQLQDGQNTQYSSLDLVPTELDQ